MTTPKLKLTFLAVLALAGCSQILGIDDYDIDKKLDGAAGDDGNHGGQGNEGGSRGGTTGQAGAPDNQAGAPDNQAGAPSMGGTPNGGSSGMAGASAGDSGGAGGDGGRGPEIIPCDSSECCEDEGGTVVETELLLNGDFERGRAEWGMSSDNDFPLFYREAAEAYSGEWYAWLGGSQNDVGILISPAFAIPAGTGWLGISGYRYLVFDSEEMFTDFAQIDLYDPEGDVEEPLFLWDNAEYNSSDWVLFGFDYPIGSYTATSHHIVVTAVTDDQWDVDVVDPMDPDPPVDQEASNFYFDDLSFKAFTCTR